MSSPEAPTSQPTIAAQVSVGEVCGVSTDGRDRLHVSFTLVNASDVSLRVLKVEPAFPMGGLRALSSSFRGTACDGPSQVASDRELVQGRTLPVVLRLALPVTCAAPLPVQAVVTTESHGLRAHQRVAVLRDLGGVELDACR